MQTTRKGNINMNKIGLVLLVTGVAACSPGQVEMNKGPASYAWVGCHVVTQNPAPSGEYATSVHAGDLPVGSKFYMKQVGHDGSVGPVTTGEPCDSFYEKQKKIKMGPKVSM